MADGTDVLAALDFDPHVVCSYPDCSAPPLYRYRCGNPECRTGGLMCDRHHTSTLGRVLRCLACDDYAFAVVRLEVPRGTA